jgi:hypothetical protein
MGQVAAAGSGAVADGTTELDEPNRDEDAFETAGSLNGGRRVWVLATLPEHVPVGGDAMRPYVLLMSSHDGSTAVIAATRTMSRSVVLEVRLLSPVGVPLSAEKRVAGARNTTSKR